MAPTSRTALAAACALVAGCAAMDASQCGAANWYDLGFRDGLFGMQSQEDIYDAQCVAQGKPIDRPRYAEGWRHGSWELQARRGHAGEE